MSADDIALEMRGVSKRFGAVEALRDVSLRARRGTVHALVGENGAGKSTLMKILAGALEADAGELVVSGGARRFERPSDALAAGVAMIYQELSLAPDLTVAQNLYLGAEPRRAGMLRWVVDERAMAEGAAALAAEHGFSIDPGARVCDLSVADAQIVEILRALARDASILVMDEPTSSLGRDEAAALLDTVRGLRARGVTVLYISHRLEEVAALADDLTVLRDGRAVWTGPAAALGLDAVVRHMVGRDLAELYPRCRRERGEPVLVVEGLSADGVEDVSFEVRRGEILGVAGLVGAGRTALAEAIFGLRELTNGRVTVGGEPYAPAGPAEALERGVMLLTEDRKRTGLCLDLPSSWNVSLPCLGELTRWSVVDAARERAAVTAVAERLALRWAGPEAPAHELSGGNQQKLLLARALLARSEVLILDEPTRGVDVGAKADISRLLGDLAAEGKALVLISSELPELFGMSDRLLVMRRGRLVGTLVTAEQTPEEVMRLAAVEEAA